MTQLRGIPLTYDEWLLGCPPVREMSQSDRATFPTTVQQGDLLDTKSAPETQLRIPWFNGMLTSGVCSPRPMGKRCWGHAVLETHQMWICRVGDHHQSRHLRINGAPDVLGHL